MNAYSALERLFGIPGRFDHVSYVYFAIKVIEPGLKCFADAIYSIFW